MNAHSDYYVLLEVGHAAAPDEIKRAFHRLAKRYHPDRNRGDRMATELFKEIRQAYQVLSDPIARMAYDSSEGRKNGDGAPYGNQDAFVMPNLDGHAFATLFQQVGNESPERMGSVFAQFMHEAPKRRGQDLEVQLHLGFEEALHGGKREVPHPGGGRLNIMVPNGVRSNVRVRIPGRGGAAPDVGGDPGDLYVTFRVEPSGHFRREGDDLHVVETVSALEAMLGSTRCIPNAYGKNVKLPIPPGTQPGERLRLRGQGVATDRGVGDLYVEVQVAVPRDLTEEQRNGLLSCARKHGLL